MGTPYISRVVMEFGKVHAVPELAEVVMELFQAALRPSSHRTYRTGQRAYSRFICHDGGRTFPIQT